MATEKLEFEEFEEFEEEGGASGGSGSFSLQSLLRTLKRKSLLVTGITTLCTSAAYFMASSSPPTYTGFFQLLVESPTVEARLADPTTVTRGGGRVPSNNYDTIDYPTQIAILKSPQVLTPVLELVRDEQPSFRDNFSLARLQQNLAIGRASNRARMIEVVYRDEDPRLVKEVLDQLEEKYLDYSLAERKSRIGEGVGFINAQIPILQSRADELQGQIEALQQQYSFFNPEIESQALSELKRQVTLQRQDTERELREQRQLSSSLQEQVQLAPEEARAALALSEDPQYQTLVQSLYGVEQQLATELSRFKPGTPPIESLQGQRDRLESLLRDRATEVLGAGLQSRLNDSQAPIFLDSTRKALIQRSIEAQTNLEVLDVRVRSLEERETALQRQIDTFPSVLRQYTEAARQLEIVNGTLARLLNEREKLQVEAAQSQVPWEVVTEPRVLPGGKSYKKALVAGFGGGLTIGFAIAWLLEKHRNIFFSREDLQEVTDLPLLATIPHCESLQPTATPLAAIADTPEAELERDANLSEFLEAFNAFYAKLSFHYADPERPLKSLAISSSETKDGKTTVVLHLAQAIAATGQRVLVVDTNLRSPQLHERLGVADGRGLKQLLVAPSMLDESDAIERLPFAKELYVLRAGGSSSSAAQLLASDRMAKLMERWAQEYDLVIYDTAHLKGLSDAQFVASNTGGLILTLRIGGTKRSDFVGVLRDVEALKLRILGLVANEGRPQSNPPVADDDDLDSDEGDSTSTSQSALSERELEASPSTAS